MNHCHICMNFNKESLYEQSDENELIKDWLKICNEGVSKGQWSWGNIFPPRPIKSNTPKLFTPTQHSAVYLINDDKIDLLKSKGQYLIARAGEEIDVLSRLWMDDRQYVKNIFNELNDWSDLSPYVLPCSDIILIDQFILSDINMLESNFYKLLEILCKDVCGSRMNIVLFSRNKDALGIEPDWKTIAKEIKNRVETITQFKPYVTIVTGSRDKLGEHDRTIFTNYMFLDSGDSFNYFNSTGEKITKGRYFRVNSMASKANMEAAREFIKDMQNLYDSIKKSNPNNIYKDAKCECNYINLS